MKEQLAWAMGKPGSEDAMLSDQSDSYGYYGRIHEARDFSQRAINSAKLADANQAAAIWQVNAALREAEFGNLVFARQAVSNALALSTDSDTEVLSALALARIGHDARALKLAKKISQEYPRDTMWRAYWLPTIRASIELKAGDPPKAVELLNASVEYDLGETETFLTGPMYPTYVRGIAYLKMHEGPSAAAEFQRIIDHRGLVQNFPLGALAHLQLARALSMNGYTLRAKATYQDFFALWKDADPDIPILKEAKAEYAKLQ
jgi:tetratricopeptide (TPR) repeat protein